MSNLSDFSYCEVILPVALTGTFTYLIPQNLQDKIALGKRVVVPFRTGKLYTGIVHHLHNQSVDFKTREVTDVLDESPIVTKQHIDFWEWISNYYLCSIGEVYAAAVLQVLRPDSKSKIKFNENINPDYFEFEYSSFDEHQKTLVNALRADSNSIYLKDVLNIAGKRKITELLAKGILVVEEELQQKNREFTEEFVTLNEEYLSDDKLQELIEKYEKREQWITLILILFQHFKKGTAVSKKNLLKTEGISKSAFATLQKNGIIKVVATRPEKIHPASGNILEIVLTEAQENAYREIKTGFTNYHAGLLFGVTGSGKTEIYFKVIKDFLTLNKSVLYMLPEIALTEILLVRLKKIFGDAVLLYHSRINENERAEIFKSLCLSNHPVLIIGSRSSLFLPFKNLGLIIVDEEHDASYKQYEANPRYNARDAAVYMAAKNGIKVLLGSATPSSETFINCLKQKYFQVNLGLRYGKSVMPSVEIIDLFKEKKSNRIKSVLSEKIIAEIKSVLQRKEQVILFQNRRGFAPLLYCENCNWTPFCPHCDVPLNYHKSATVLRCHYCGHTEQLISSCKACGSARLSIKGFGTERIEEDIQLFFPELNVARFDLDSTRSKHSFYKITNDFADGKIQILVGTQMVSKGLDFANVGLVGILNADSLLHFSEYKSYERAVQLMVQISGRAGRSEKTGKVMVQTYAPQHFIFSFLHDAKNYDVFLHWLLKERKQYQYPPFTHLIKIMVRHTEKQDCEVAANYFCKLLISAFKTGVLGPEYGYIQKIRGYYNMHILLKLNKTESYSASKKLLNDCLEYNRKHNPVKGFKMAVDVDY